MLNKIPQLLDLGTLEIRSLAALAEEVIAQKCTIGAEAKIDFFIIYSRFDEGQNSKIK